MNRWKLTDLTVKNICFTGELVKRQITDSISENLTDSYLESKNHSDFRFIRTDSEFKLSLNQPKIGLIRIEN